jgi:hypothetical protein
MRTKREKIECDFLKTWLSFSGLFFCEVQKSQKKEREFTLKNSNKQTRARDSHLLIKYQFIYIYI